MKKSMIVAAMLAMVATGANAKSATDSATIAKNKPVFTVVKQNPITSIKDQNRSGTCWAYSTLSYFESEILKKTGKTYDLSEMFVANKTYMDRATVAVRMHGDVSFSEGGSAYDVLYALQHYGIVPESTMPAPGSLTGDSLANFGEFFAVMTPYVEAVAKSTSKKLSPAWKSGLQGIIDSYIGKTPAKFTYEGKQYTPQSFCQSLGLNLDDYVTITSYTHHPMWSKFAVEVQDNWRWPLSYNVPMEDICKIIDNAVNNGYTVAWGGDVTEDGFTRKGLGIAYDVKKVRSMAGTDADHWFKLSKDEKKEKFDSLGVNAPEIVPTQAMRQEAFDNWETTDDHGMVIIGKAEDQKGNKYYKVKNSWDTDQVYQGYFYVSEAYFLSKTMSILVNKKAVPSDLLKKMGL